MEIIGSDGVLTRTNKVKSPLILIRDDQPTYRHVIQGNYSYVYETSLHMHYQILVFFKALSHMTQTCYGFQTSNI